MATRSDGSILDDAFVAANGTLLQTFSGWSRNAATTGTSIEVLANRLISPTPTIVVYNRAGVPGSSTYTVEAEVFFASTSRMIEVVISFTAGFDGYSVLWDGAEWSLNRYAVGAPSLAATSTSEAPTVGADVNVAVRRDAGRFRVYIDDVEIIDYTDPSPFAPAGVALISANSAKAAGVGGHIRSISAGAWVPPLVAGTVTVDTVNGFLVTASATDATGGTAPYTYQWQRSARGAGTWSDLSGQTDRTRLIDRTVSPSTNYDYRLVYTDDDSTTANSALAEADVPAQTVVWGAMGDSNTDEYRADDDRNDGSAFESSTLNAVEQLAEYKSLDFGTFSASSRGEPRRAGYEYVWSRSGVVMSSVEGAQETGIVSQIEAGTVTHVVLQATVNEFVAGGRVADYYDSGDGGTTGDSGENIAGFAASYAAQVEGVIDALIDAGAVGIVVLPPPDYIEYPSALTTYPNATRRGYFTACIEDIETDLTTKAGAVNTAQGATVVQSVRWDDDLKAAWSTLSGGEITLAGAVLDPGSSPGDGDPAFLFTDPDAHLGAVGSGVVANTIVAAANNLPGISLTPFTDAEIRSNAGILDPVDPGEGAAAVVSDGVSLSRAASLVAAGVAVAVVTGGALLGRTAEIPEADGSTVGVVADGISLERAASLDASGSTVGVVPDGVALGRAAGVPASGSTVSVVVDGLELARIADVPASGSAVGVVTDGVALVGGASLDVSGSTVGVVTDGSALARTASLDLSGAVVVPVTDGVTLPDAADPAVSVSGAVVAVITDGVAILGGSSLEPTGSVVGVATEAPSLGRIGSVAATGAAVDVVSEPPTPTRVGPVAATGSVASVVTDAVSMIGGASLDASGTTVAVVTESPSLGLLGAVSASGASAAALGASPTLAKLSGVSPGEGAAAVATDGTEALRVAAVSTSGSIASATTDGVELLGAADLAVSGSTVATFGDYLLPGLLGPVPASGSVAVPVTDGVDIPAAGAVDASGAVVVVSSDNAFDLRRNAGAAMSPPTPLDAPMVALSANLIERFGRRATYVRANAGDFDPALGGFSSPKTTTETVLKILPTDSRSTTFPEGLVQRSDLTALVAQNALVGRPNPGRDRVDVVESGSLVRYRLVDFEPIASGSDEAIFELLLRN